VEKTPMDGPTKHVFKKRKKILLYAPSIKFLLKKKIVLNAKRWKKRRRRLRSC
jgi:hypothetical protein